MMVFSMQSVFVLHIWIARKYMHKGITVWLDVPLKALAQRIAAVGTDSRPLLHYEAGDSYTRVSISLPFHFFF